MIGVGGPGGHDHADKDDSRREDVAGKLEPGEKDRGRLRDDARDQVMDARKALATIPARATRWPVRAAACGSVAARPAALASAPLEACSGGENSPRSKRWGITCWLYLIPRADEGDDATALRVDA